MPHIIPIRDLCKTVEISELCKNTKEPIYVTKNGYADLVIMDAQAYDAKMAKYDIYEKLAAGLKDIEEGRVSDGEDAMRRIKEKHGF